MTPKERYHYMKKHKKCVRCGNLLDKEETAYCSMCKKITAENRREWYAQCKNEHRCVTCGKPLPENYKRVRCSLCAEKNTNRIRESKQKEKMEILKKYRKKEGV